MKVQGALGVLFYIIISIIFCVSLFCVSENVLYGFTYGLPLFFSFGVLYYIRGDLNKSSALMALIIGMLLCVLYNERIEFGRYKAITHCRGKIIHIKTKDLEVLENAIPYLTSSEILIIAQGIGVGKCIAISNIIPSLTREQRCFTPIALRRLFFNQAAIAFNLSHNIKTTKNGLIKNKIISNYL